MAVDRKAVADALARANARTGLFCIGPIPVETERGPGWYWVRWRGRAPEMNAGLRGAAFAAGAMLTAAGKGVLLGYGIARAAEALRDVHMLDVPLWGIAAGMVALGVPLLAWGSRIGGGAG